MAPVTLRSLDKAWFKRTGTIIPAGSVTRRGEGAADGCGSGAGAVATFGSGCGLATAGGAAGASYGAGGTKSGDGFSAGGAAFAVKIGSFFRISGWTDSTKTSSGAGVTWVLNGDGFGCTGSAEGAGEMTC